MAKYKIITLYLSGNGKRVLKAGEIVGKEELIKQNIAKLLKTKQIKLVSGKDDSETAGKKAMSEAKAKSEEATKVRAQIKADAEKAKKAKEAADAEKAEAEAKAKAEAKEAAEAAKKDTDAKK